MPTLRVKAETLLLCARSIEDENYHDDVTAEEQRLLEEVVRAIRAAANLLLLHVSIIERVGGIVEPIEKESRQDKRKLRVVK